MRYACPILFRPVAAVAILASCARIGQGYELAGRLDPPLAVAIFLHGATAPFESSATSDPDGRFLFAKVPAGTYTLVAATAARGELVQTIELTAGTVDAKGRLDLVLTIDRGRLESDGARSTGATISTSVLSIPERARKEYEEADRCLNRQDSACAVSHLRRAVELAHCRMESFGDASVPGATIRGRRDGLPQGAGRGCRGIRAFSESGRSAAESGQATGGARLQPARGSAKAQRRSGEFAARADVLLSRRFRTSGTTSVSRGSTGPRPFLASAVDAGADLSQARGSCVRG